MKSWKSYCTTPGVGVGVDIGVGIGVGSISKMLKFYVKVFYVMGKALSGELSCPWDRSCKDFSSEGGGRVVRWSWVNFQCRGIPLDVSRARACSRWGLFGHFYSPLSFLSSFSLSLGDGPIQTEILSQRAVKPNTTDQISSEWGVKSKRKEFAPIGANSFL